MVLCAFIIFIQNLVASCPDMCDSHIEAMVGSLDGLSRTQLKTQEGWQLCLERAQANVAEGKNVKGILLPFRAKAQTIFNDNINILSKGWCKTFNHLKELPKKLLPKGRVQHRAFLEIALYCNLADYVSGVKRAGALFVGDQEPSLEDLSSGSQMLEHFIMYGRDSIFLLKETLFFNFIECLVAMAQGKALFVLTNQWEGVGDQKAHGDSYKGSLELLLHDEQHAANTQRTAMIFNMLSPGLHQDFAAKALEVIGEHWESQGLELLFVTFGLLHEAFLGKEVLKDRSDNLFVKINNSSDGDWWQGDQVLIRMLDELLSKIGDMRPWDDLRMQYVKTKEKFLIRSVCEKLQSVCALDTVKRQKEICDTLSAEWGVPVTLDRKSHLALAKVVINKICDIEQVSDDHRRQIMYVVEKKRYDKDDPIVFFGIAADSFHTYSLCPKKHTFAIFPTWNRIHDPLCTSAERLLFLREVIDCVDSARKPFRVLYNGIIADEYYY